MKPIRISQQAYRDKVFACWLGKNIGGTLGAPYEGRKEIHSLTYYDPVPDQSAANDDLDLQLVWLKMLQERGIRPRLADFADYWQKHLAPYPWNEYGFCQRNLTRGLRPPISGWFENYFVDELGAPIRSETWACAAPGDPQLAAALAWKDAVLDHAGGEGVHGEMFWAAVESAAFVVTDPETLLGIGLAMIPGWSRISRVVREVLRCRRSGVAWREARERVVQYFGHTQPCHAVQNIGFTVIGWLYGEDYGDRLCTTINCAYDTDSTGATIGALLGILGGTAGIPDRWRDPIGEGIVLHRYTRDLDAPKTVGELTDQTAEIARQMVAQRSDAAEFAAETHLSDDALSVLFRSDRALDVLARDVHAATVPASDEVEITLHYHGEPVLRPQVTRILGVTVERGEERVEAPVELQVPAGWQVEPAPAAFGQTRFAVTAPEMTARQTLTVTARLPQGPCSADFVVLSPQQAQGCAAGQNVEGCPHCRARIEACVCER